MAVTELRKIHHVGLMYQKVEYIDVNTFFIVAQRELSDAKDVVQTVFIRAIYNLQGINEKESEWESSEVD